MPGTKGATGAGLKPGATQENPAKAGWTPAGVVTLTGSEMEMLWRSVARELNRLQSTKDRAVLVSLGFKLAQLPGPVFTVRVVEDAKGDA